MTWLAIDTRSATEAMLSMPRVPPTGASGIGNWLLMARRAARLDHPDLAKVVECGVNDHWPFVAVDRRAGVTLDEWLAQHPAAGVEDAAFWIASVLRGSRSPTTPASRTSTCRATTCSSTSAAKRA